MTRRSRFLRSVAALGVASLALTACGGGDDEGASGSGGDSESVKLAFMGASTGPNAQLGINILNGVKLAVDEHNAKSGATKVELLEYDTQGDPNQATAVAPKLVSDKVVGVVGPAFSGESKNAVPILEEAKIPNISPSATNALLSQNGWKFWHRVLANDDVQGPGVAQFIANQLAGKKVAVIDDQSEYGKGIADVVAKTLGGSGATVNPREAIDPKADDYSSTVNKIKGAGVDTVFYGGYYAEAAKFVKQLRDSGVQAKFVSGDGTLDQKFIDGAPTQSEGAYLSCTCVVATASDDPAVQKFIDDYKKTAGADPATYSAEGYDAATAFLKAIEDGKKTPEEINDFLATLEFEGVSKPIKWESNGELSGGSVYMHEVKDAKIVPLGDVKTAAVS